MTEKNKIKNRQKFTKWHETVEEVYKDEASWARLAEHRTVSRRLRTITTKDALRDNLDFSLDDSKEIAEASRTLHALDSNYAKIISYFADMFYTRYTVTPEIELGVEMSSEEYTEIYNEMMAAVDGLNLENLMPDVLRELFITGAVYLHSEENQGSETTTIRILPSEYCRTIFSTNFGTNGIQFNFKYFDNFQDEELLKETLALFPKEFTSLYDEYLKSGEEWLSLDPRITTSILANEYSIPPFINALIGILEYEDTRDVELKKAHRELKKILIHRIPIEDGMPIFEVDEVASIQKAIARVTRNHDGLETITAFGETQLHDLQKEGNIENKRIDQAHKSIFNSAGLNAAYFADNVEFALAVNRSIDKGTVWSFIQKFNAYLNLAINQLYDFKNAQAIIKILPVTIHEEKATVELYRENASYGIGKLDAIVAAGTRQKDLMSGLRLEEELGLNELLTPLQSAHTQSGAETEEKETDDTVNVEEEIENPEKEESISEEEVDDSEE